VCKVVSEYAADLLCTTRTRHACDLASSIDERSDILLVAGGDGTLHEVIDGMMQRPVESRPPILLIPLGSGNDTARMIGARATLADIQRRISAQQAKDWDVLECTIGAEQVTRYCTNVLDVGFGGEVARRYTNGLRKLPARLGYVTATLQGFVSSKARRMSVRIDDVLIDDEMLLTAVANSKWFGSGIGIAPLAQPDDGVFDITVVKNVGPLTYARFLPDLMRGVPIRDPRIHYHSGRECMITTNEPLPIEIDGEFVGFTPIMVKVHHKAVRLLV
jgi:YegS/Rv2252/BmrU family lipid kinase